MTPSPDETMTTTPGRPAAWEPLETALRQRHPINLTYHATGRLICPHALGWHNHRPMLLAYQTTSHTTTATPPSDASKRWRCMYIDEIEHIAAAEPAAPWETADNYNPAHPFNTIDHVTIAIA